MMFCTYSIVLPQRVGRYWQIMSQLRLDQSARRAYTFFSLFQWHASVKAACLKVHVPASAQCRRKKTEA
jgi:hypothetical protein